MHTAPEDFAETYRLFPDEEIAAIYADIDSLTVDARSALMAEAQTRGLSDEQLKKLHAVELRREAQFDRLESFRRKKLGWGRFLLWDRYRSLSPRDWIIAILIAISVILISELLSRHH